MTREEAINMLKNTAFFIRGTDRFDDALDVAIEALEDIHEMSMALDRITYHEGSTYGFDDAVKNAMKWIERGE